MTDHHPDSHPDAAAAAWRRLRDLVWVAPLLLTALAPLLTLTDGALAPVSVVVVRALLAAGGGSDPDTDADRSAPAPLQAQATLLRRSWDPQSRPQPVAALSLWIRGDAPAALATPEPVALPPAALRPVASPLFRPRLVAAAPAVTAVPARHAPIRGPPAA